MSASISSTRSFRPTEDPMSLSRSETTDESAGSGAESRARRKFARTTNESDNPLRRQLTSSPSKAAAPEQQKPVLAARRRSVRDYKAPLGPRPLDHNPSRRVISGSTNESAPATRSFLPTSSSEPYMTQPIRGSNPRFSFGKAANGSKSEESTDESGTYDFLPSINFDDFHTNISSTAPQDEPALSDFPAPGGRTIFANAVDTRARPSEMISTVDKLHEGQPTRVTRSDSIARRLSNARRQVSGSTADSSTSMPPPSAPLTLRTRRQSQFPAPAPANPAARAPRKSVGPGLNLDTRNIRHETTEPVPETPQNFLSRTSSIGQNGRRGTLTQSISTSNIEAPRLANGSRNLKAKSLQPPPRQIPVHLTTSSMTPDQASVNARSPGRSPRQGQNTPSSSSSKRQSTIAHVGGLGARTISPTDARRLKRLSMLPKSPTAPELPISPELSVKDQPFVNSPSTALRKSSTPISTPGTPDLTHKLFNPSLSVASNTSLSSLRTLNAIGNRSSVNLAGSRLPQAKARNVHSSAGLDEEEEEVPPVPAIPKAYESPKDAPEHPAFPFPKRKTSAQWNESRLGQSLIEENNHEKFSVDGPNTMIDTQPTHVAQKPSGSTRHRRGLTTGSTDSKETPIVAQVNKRSLQPLRLPPLNLLPFNAPVSNRSAALPVPSGEVDDRDGATTPPKRQAKTPSTPMTASKATFFSRHPEQAHARLRSSSSQWDFRAETSFHSISQPHLISQSPVIPVPSSAIDIPTPIRQTATTPFSSASLPKNSVELSQLRGRPSGEYRPSLEYRPSGEYQLDGAGPSNKPHGPRSQTTLHKDNASIQSIATETSGESEAPSSNSGEKPVTSGLRRKLSLGWRRGTSRTSNIHQKDGAVSSTEALIPKPMSSDMPPPRLPASATAHGPGASPAFGGDRMRASLDARRRKTSGTNFTSDTEAEKRTTHFRKGSQGLQAPTASTEQKQSPRAASAIMGAKRMIGLKTSQPVLATASFDTSVLDKEDTQADEEMKKLASRRRDFQSAAKELDELRKNAKPKQCVAPSAVLQQGVVLNLFERGEIIDYGKEGVYFCGIKTAKKHVGDLASQSTNFGYDDERGDYNIVLGDHLCYRYEVVDVLGKGSFGQVVRCVDHKTGMLVAIKIIRNKKRFHQQALVEVNILQKLREWDPNNKHSMINFTQSFYFRGHLCISTELLGMNLYELIKAYDFKGFSLKIIRRMTKQMLSSLMLLQNKRVIHCDLKPENILLAHPYRAEIKVIDFGSSCFENEKVYTYIQSRFYRSPEVILGMSYGMPIDMWSLGCILAELYTGYPIFPGENEQEQLACIMEIFGPPEKHLIEKSSRKKLFFDSLGKPRVTVSSKGKRRRVSSKQLPQVLKCDDEAFLDFISRCLRWDPDRRMKPAEAAQHEFITGQKLRPAARSTIGRPQVNGAAISPMKRAPVVPTPQRTRPLPEPPATAIKNGIPAPQLRESSSSSPVKAAVARRQSTATSTTAQSSIGVKRTSNGSTVNAAASAASGLPRIAQRSVSGKSDLASAAAVASLHKPR